MNLPNKLTVLRILLVPLFLVLLMCPFTGHYAAACAVFGLAAITDLLDGKIARKQGLVTNLGKFLDPIADKVLTTAAFLGILALAAGHPSLDLWCWIWCLMLILAREFVVATVRMMAAGSGEVVAADLLGKIKTVVQYVLIVLVLLLAEADALLGHLAAVAPWIDGGLFVCNFLMIGTAVMTVISGAQYVVRHWRFLH